MSKIVLIGVPGAPAKLQDVVSVATGHCPAATSLARLHAITNETRTQVLTLRTQTLHTEKDQWLYPML